MSIIKKLFDIIYRLFLMMICFSLGLFLILEQPNLTIQIPEIFGGNHEISESEVVLSLNQRREAIQELKEKPELKKFILFTKNSKLAERLRSEVERFRSKYGGNLSIDQVYFMSLKKSEYTKFKKYINELCLVYNGFSNNDRLECVTDSTRSTDFRNIVQTINANIDTRLQGHEEMMVKRAADRIADEKEGRFTFYLLLIFSFLFSQGIISVSRRRSTETVN
ncbi:MAG: hypothetical protein COB41_06425 [Proteobacteria bacterium]|nr:MAG: hypothetical protein COB41_06425 [Pseudomonadota bacterium]